MKFTKHLISGAVALAVAGTLGMAYAQTNAPGTSTPSAQAPARGLDKSATIPSQGTTGSTGTMGTNNSGTMTQQGTSGTTGTMNSGSNATMSNDSTTGNRTTTGSANNRRMNADGTMSTELAARADRG